MPSALMVTSSFLPGMGGIESYLAQLCAELAPRLAVLAPARRDGKTVPGNLDYPVYGYSGPMLAPTPAMASAVITRARLLGTERILFGTPWPLVLLGPGLARTGLRYAAIVHGAELLVPGAVPGLSRSLARALAGADLLLPVSEFTARATHDLLERHGLRASEVEVLRARVDLDRFRPDVPVDGTRRRLGLAPEAPVVLSFGRLVRRKGVHRLVAVAPMLAERVPGATVVVAGTGPQKASLERQAARLGAPVLFAGRVPDEEAPSLYAAADVFCLPVVDRLGGLEVEGLGVVLLEAMACETPAVTGRSGGTPEAVLDGQTGYVIDACDPLALLDALAALVGDRKRASEMGRHGRKHVREQFTQRPLPAGLLRWLGQGVR